MRGSRYILKGGIIVAFVCKIHGRQTPDRGIMAKRKDGTTSIICSECNDDARDRRRGERDVSKYGPQEYRRYEVEGVLGKECGKCGVWKPEVDFTKLREGAWRHCCKACWNEDGRARRYLRLIRKSLPEHSPEVQYAQNEKRSHHLQALCWLSSVLTDRVLPTEERERFLPTLRRVRDTQGTTLQEKIEVLIPSLPKGQRGDYPVEVRSMPEVQIYGRF